MDEQHNPADAVSQDTDGPLAIIEYAAAHA